MSLLQQLLLMRLLFLTCSSASYVIVRPASACVASDAGGINRARKTSLGAFITLVIVHKCQITTFLCFFGDPFAVAAGGKGKCVTVVHLTLPRPLLHSRRPLSLCHPGAAVAGPSQPAPPPGLSPAWPPSAFICASQVTRRPASGLT